MKPKCIVITQLPGNGGDRDFDLFDYLTNELDARGIKTRIVETSALHSLIETIDTTGGVAEVDIAQYVPVADYDWIDLGDAYMQACEAVGHAPLCEGMANMENVL
jgi:hypothetical protein